MAYTPPAKNAADFNFPGVYVAPSKTAVDLDFTSVSLASGFLATQFGTPNMVCEATGFVVTQFGTPYVPFATGWLTTNYGSHTGSTYFPAEGWQVTQYGSAHENVPWAVGFSSTQFGTPSVSPWAVGFLVTQFGTPFGQSVNLIISGQGIDQVTRFGTPYITFDQTADASGFLATAFGPFPWYFIYNQSYVDFVADAHGWEVTRFGTPNYNNPASGFLATQFGSPWYVFDQTWQQSGWLATQFGQPRTEVLPAEGFLATTFGTPAVEPFNQTLTATGFLASNFGTPRSGATHAVTGFQVPVTFGTPSRASVGRASSFRPVRFGIPGYTLYAASSINRRVLLGRPTAIKGGHTAYGFVAGRWFGNPRGASVSPHVATGLSSTQFGSPDSYFSGKALHIPPVVNHGTPQMQRS